jgi:hypothetical protein
MATGGMIGRGGGRGRGGRLSERRDQRQHAREQRKNNSLVGMAKKKILNKDIIYLMVTNLPTEEEQALANQVQLI